MVMSLLEARGITAGYNRSPAFEGVGLRVGEGEIVCILGPNGAGKSTLLRSLVGALPYYGGTVMAGSVLFRGREVLGLEPHALLGLGISFVPDGGRVFAGMTVIENLQMGGFCCRNKSVVADRIQEVLARFPLLTKVRERMAASLSTGERQILALARSLVSEPKLLVLDEPTSGLSPGYAKLLLSALQDTVQREARAVLLVEQNIHLATSYSDRGYLLQYGKIDPISIRRES